jgi:hypothetical protein
MHIRRRILAVFGAAAAVLAFAVGPAGADPTGGVNQVVVVQTSTDGSWDARGGTQVAPAGGGTVTSANIAAATTSGCAGCHAAAVAVQVVLVTGGPSYFAPANVAAATTGGCDGCGAYAYAWQYVLEAATPVRFNAAAQQKIAELRGEIADAAASILPSDRVTDPCLMPDAPPDPCETRDQQLDAKLNALTAELKATVDDAVQEAGVHATGSVDRQVRDSNGF